MPSTPPSSATQRLAKELEGLSTVVGKAGNVKGQIMSFYDMPSTSLMNQYADVRL